MVSRRIFARPVQVLALATVAVVGLIVVPATSGLAAPTAPTAPTAPAAPAPTAAEARKTHAALATKMAKATEDYNTAGVMMTRGKAQEKVLRGQAATQQAKVNVYEEDVAEFAASAYRGGRIDVVTSLLQSGSPQNFLDQISTLDSLSRTQRAQLNRLMAAKRALDMQQQKIAAAVAAQRLNQQTIKTRRATIEKDLKTWAALDSKLNPRSTGGGPTGGVYNGPASGNARTALNAAYAQLGKSYVWGAAGPDTFDCSGLTMYAWAKAGVSLPHSSRMQYSGGRKVARADLQPGDLVFGNSPISHVGMYVGNGNMIHAPQTGDVVKISPLLSSYVGAIRP